ncbi:MAG: hypothetical protein QG639_1105 [Patescibacteria group bacterium]|nr:hypothetical protein [Patescibacteria group bacterium]
MRGLTIWLARQVNGLFPFLYPLLHIFKGGHFITGIFAYYRDLLHYKSLRKDSSPFPINIKHLYPIYYDRYDEAGELPRHYFYQDIWAAMKVFNSKVKHHYDIGSRLDGFIAHCLPFCTVTMIDIRPLNYKIPNLSFIQTNGSNMDSIKSGSISSLSCLHAVEHFGLGRYSDPVDPEGYVKAIHEFQRVVKKGGTIYFGTPIGKQRLEFNAHRVFDPAYVVRLFDKCSLVDFAAVDDLNNYLPKANIKDFSKATYSCGLFQFKKK